MEGFVGSIYSAPENIFGPGIQIFTAQKTFSEHWSQNDYLDIYIFKELQQSARF